MADSALNIVNPSTPTPVSVPGDVPDRLRRRYLTEARDGPGLGFYVDARVATAAFRDEGRRLSTDRNDPAIVRDLVEIARHRGWTIISVRGQTDFRREVWTTARAAGLEVRGYTPTERDLQDLARRAERRRPAPGDHTGPETTASGSPARLRVVEAVVRDRIVEPAVQARILASARARIADWLERGARLEPPRPERPARARDR